MIKPVICVFKKTQKGQQMHFMAEKTLRKRSDFVIYSYFKDSEFTVVKMDVKIHTLYVKRVPFLFKNGI